jgi:hypothetical protein
MGVRDLDTWAVNLLVYVLRQGVGTELGRCLALIRAISL